MSYCKIPFVVAIVEVAIVTEYDDEFINLYHALSIGANMADLDNQVCISKSYSDRYGYLMLAKLSAEDFDRIVEENCLSETTYSNSEGIKKIRKEHNRHTLTIVRIPEKCSCGPNPDECTCEKKEI